MYKIRNTNTGVCVGMTEAPNYIKKAENGCYVLCPEPEASGIAFEGEVFHLLGKEALEGVDTVALEEVDGGMEFFNAQASTAEQLAQADETAIELYEAQAVQDEINAAQDDALIELYEMIGG